MKYLFQPLDRTDLYLRFFEERCRLNKTFVPDYSGYYLGQYDIDAYDRSSLAIGIFEVEGEQKPIGFARITPSNWDLPYFLPNMPSEIRHIIREASSEPPYPLPLWENYDLGKPSRASFPFTLWGKRKKCVEVGRLMILGENPSPRLALNFLTYLLALPKYLGADYMLASHTETHHRFYANFFGISEAFSEAYSHNDAMMAALYELDKPLKHNQELLESLQDTFAAKGYANPIVFEQHVLSIPQPVNV